MVSPETGEFFKLGMQYYVAARFSAFAWLSPVCGNLFHHAVEMFLKGHLAATMNLAELKRFQHRLRDLWAAYQQVVSDETLTRFDQTVSGLDEFESIRYPDRIVAHGMYSIISIDRRQPDESSPLAPQEPRFEVVVKEIDELVGVLFEKASLNPPFFTAGLGADAKEYLGRDNETAVLQIG